MVKKVAPVSALLLAFALLVSPAGILHAQTSSTSTPAVVTGGDPEPPGEPSVITALAMAALISLGLA